MAGLEPDDVPAGGAAPPPRRPRVVEGVAIAAAVVILAGLAWYLMRPAPDGTAPPGAGPAPVVAAPAGAPSADAPAAAAEPVMEPAAARDAARELSDDAAYRRWVGEGELEERWAFAIAGLAEGVTPRRVLEPFAPEGPFTAREEGGKKVIAEEAHARYDGFARAVAAIDARRAARIYRALRPGVEAAYRALGARGTLDEALARALRRIAEAPVRDEPVEVVEQGGIWAFAEPALEDADEVTKQLLRMGPRNTRRLQEAARVFGEAVGAPGRP